MRKSRKFISMPIISIEEGQQIGSVRTLVIDPEKKEIAALVIEQRGWFKDQKIIPYSKVHSVGGDAITVERNSNAEKQTNLPHIVKLIKDKYELIGCKIVTENGVILGFVDEFYVDLISGKITSLEISGRLLNSLFNGKASLDTDYVKTIGKEVLVAFEGAENQLRQIEAGLRESVKSIKESTTSFWETTVKKTKEITENINHSFEKKKSPAEAEDDLPEALEDEFTDITEYRDPDEPETEDPQIAAIEDDTEITEAAEELLEVSETISQSEAADAADKPAEEIVDSTSHVEKATKVVNITDAIVDESSEDKVI